MKNIIIRDNKDFKVMIENFINEISKLEKPTEIHLIASKPIGVAKIVNKKGVPKDITKKEIANRELLTNLRDILKDKGHTIPKTTYGKTEETKALKTSTAQANTVKTKPKKYYAIKEGKGVTNKIVDTWEECKKYVNGYNAVYKSFFSIEECEEYLGTVNVEKVKASKEYVMEQKRIKKETKGNTININISEEMKRDLELRSKKVGLKVDDIIRFALNQYLY